MRFDQVPMPPTVAARPHDTRGYPIPAITPWEDGEPRFALNGYQETAKCAQDRLCSVCGTLMPEGPVWRVVGGTEATLMAEILADGKEYRNMAPTLEAPGHRACMLYAAMACPYLARSNARRGLDGSGDDELTAHVLRGTMRGEGGAVAGFADFEYAITRDQVLFRFLDVVEFLPHGSGDEHLDALRAEVGA